MLKKRLVGVVTIKQGWAVQSFGYKRYLPLGKPEVIVENLDRWGADEILISCIDRSTSAVGPDFELLDRVADLGLSTPVIYAGGIRDADDAVKAVKLGADRILVDSMIWDAPRELELLSRELGSQALIANLPVQVDQDDLLWKHYRTKKECKLNEDTLVEMNLEWASEVMLTDWIHEGLPDSFNERIPNLFPLKEKPLLVFGGLSEPEQIRRVIMSNNVVAACVGNFLNYKEHAIQKIKHKLVGVPIRSAHYNAQEER